MHLHRSGLYFRKDTSSLTHWRRSCFTFFDAVFIRSPARPDCAGSRPLLAAAATTERKGRVRWSLPIFLCLTLAQFTLGRLHSLLLLTGRGYLYPKTFGNRLRAREGKQPVSTQKLTHPHPLSTAIRLGTIPRGAGPAGPNIPARASGVRGPVVEHAPYHHVLVCSGMCPVAT